MLNTREYRGFNLEDICEISFARMEELELREVEVTMLKLIWTDIGMVQRLIIESVKDHSLKTIQLSLKPTRNMKELTFRNNVPVNIYLQLLEATPELKVLRVSTMTAKMLETINVKLLNLDMLEIRQFIGKLPEICYNIKHIEIHNIISKEEYNKEVRKNLKKESKWKMIWQQVKIFLTIFNCSCVIVNDN
ncbi:unnamed protein product [Diamesa serratosioi]